MQRKGFTLIELLVVIAIIAILAAILFPVFAQARETARKTVCLSNLKQCGLAMLMYAQDYDEHTVPWHAGNAGDPWNPVANPAEPHDAENFDMAYDRLIQPYAKNGEISRCPSDITPGTDKFPPNSGGVAARSYNIVGNMGGNWCPSTPPRKLAAVPRPTQTIYLNERDNCAAAIDAWGADPHPAWNWCAINDAESEMAWRHNKQANYLFVDGHAKSYPYVPGTTQGVSAGGPVGDYFVLAGMYKFPGYDWSHTDGSLWGAWNPVPGGTDILDTAADFAANCPPGPATVDIPGSQIN